MSLKPSAPGLDSFVPSLLAHRFGNGEGPQKAISESISAAVLLADISGFTALTERLTAGGAAGTEELTRTLNAHFGRLINSISEHRGDIIKFAGDALLAIWPAGEENLANAVRAATQCGLAAQAVFRDASAPESLRLSLRIAIGAGPISLLVVGGVNGRWETVATGEALRQLGAASHVPNPGQVAIAAPALALISSSLRVRRVEDGVGIIESVVGPDLSPPAPLLHVPIQSEAALRGFVPFAVLSHLDSNSADWMGESRRVSVIFTHFPGFNPGTPLDRAQAVMAILQSVMEKYEGSINKLSVDDKGAAMVAAFGLPPLAHEDDATRALQAAIDIRQKLGEFNVKHSTGVATGRVFCGVIGNSLRREYTMIGDVVNLSARLMQAASGEILCDDATRLAALNSFAVEPLEPILVKGKASPIAVFRPLALHVGGVKRTKTTIVGREAERTAIGELLDSLALKGEASVILIEGDAGIGKSRLVDDLVERAGAAGIPLLYGNALHIERFTPYFSWREVFFHLCGLDRVEDPEIRQRRAAGIFGGDEYYSSLLPLANPVLGVDFQDTELTASLDGPEKSARTRDLLSHLLSILPARDAAKVVILEDCQWADSASLALAVEVASKVPKLLLVVVSRPFPGVIPEEYTMLLNAPGALVIRLQPLSLDDAVRLAAQRLGVLALPEPVAALIREKAEGNPLFSEELAYTLRDTGVIEILGNECRLSPSAGDLRSIDVPDNVQAAMTGRIDRLPTAQQLLLKAGSVIGRVFALQVLSEVYPIAGEASQLVAMINTLGDRGMVFAETDEQLVAWAFRHVILQRVAYNLMLHSQRLELHRGVAQSIEKTHAADLGSYCALLAYHWSKVAEYGDASPHNVSKAIGYLKDAANQALRSAANREALSFIREALRLTLMLPEGEERDRLELSLEALSGPPLLETAGFAAPETQQSCSRAWELCQKLGTAPEKFQVLLGVWNFHVVGSKLREGLDLARQMEAMATVSNDPVRTLLAQRALGETLHWTGRPLEALKHFSNVLATYRPEHNKLPELRRGVNPAVVCWGFLGWTRWILGHPDQALVAMERGLEMARELGHPFNLALATMNAALVHQFRGESRKTLHEAETLLRAAEEQGFVLWRAGALIMRGCSLCELGELEAGLAESNRGFEQWQATGADLAGPYYLSLMAAVYLRTGNPEAGLATIDDALARAERTGELWWKPDLLRIKGDLSRALGMDAGEYYRQALLLSRNTGARSLELRASMSLSRSLAADGQRDEARSLLAGVFSQFEEGFDTGDLREARSLLAELS